MTREDHERARRIKGKIQKELTAQEAQHLRRRFEPRFSGWFGQQMRKAREQTTEEQERKEQDGR